MLVGMVAEHLGLDLRSTTGTATGTTTSAARSTATASTAATVAKATATSSTATTVAAKAAATTTTAATADTGPVLRRLSVLDRWLPAWIIAAMILGLLLGRFIPGLAQSLDAVTIGSVSVPIAIGLGALLGAGLFAALALVEAEEDVALVVTHGRILKAGPIHPSSRAPTRSNRYSSAAYGQSQPTHCAAPWKRMKRPWAQPCRLSAK